MCARRKTARKLRGACIAAGLTFFFGFAHAAGDLRINITSDAVTIKADNTSLRSVLEELSRQTHLVVVSQEALDELLSIEIDQSTLPQAIRRLLRHKSFLLQQSNPVSGSQFPGTTAYSSLWIFSDDVDNRQHAWASQPTRRPDSELDSELIDYQILASSDDARDRQEAMFGFGDIGDSNGIEYLLLGLSDPDENVREEAILSLAELGGTESVMALSIVLNDPEAKVRVDAVDALGEIGGHEAVRLLQGATADENDTVREAAAEWLTELAWMHD